MSRSLRASAHARRDAGLRRLRIVNRVLIGAAVAATGLLTDVTAHAFPGHKRRAIRDRVAGPDAGTDATLRSRRPGTAGPTTRATTGARRCAHPPKRPPRPRPPRRR